MGLAVETAGVAVALGTVLGFAVPPVAGRLTHRFGPRFTVVTAQLVQGMGAVAYLVAALWLPPGWLVPYAFAAWLLFVVANKVIYPVAGALSDALPPRNARAGYMATFQYSFTTAQVVAPAVVAQFAFSPWAPPGPWWLWRHSQRW